MYTIYCKSVFTPLIPAVDDLRVKSANVFQCRALSEQRLQVHITEANHGLVTV